jgi:hypothetical protein
VGTYGVQPFGINIYGCVGATKQALSRTLLNSRVSAPQPESHRGHAPLYIHAVEASSRPERALPYAGRIATLAPSAGHLVHMPAHIYERTGNYDGARANNAMAAKADRG